MIRRLPVALALTATLALAFALAACGTLDPEIGPERVGVPGFEPTAPDGGFGDGGEPCEIVDSDPDTDVMFPQVLSTVFNGFCSCHTTEGGIGRTLGGLDLADHDAALFGGRRGGALDVVPGDPCASIMVQKISGEPPFGQAMPLGRDPLSAANRQLIIDWIAEGAR